MFNFAKLGNKIKINPSYIPTSLNNLARIGFITKYQNLLQDYDLLKTKLEEINNQKKKEQKKEIEFSEKIDELNQETDTLLEEIDKWQM